MPLLIFYNAAIDIKKNKLRGAEKHGIDRLILKRYLEKVADKGTDDATIGLFLTQKNIY